jgi:hypothetical protein
VGNRFATASELEHPTVLPIWWEPVRYLWGTGSVPLPNQALAQRSVAPTWKACGSTVSCAESTSSGTEILHNQIDAAFVEFLPPRITVPLNS